MSDNIFYLFVSIWNIILSTRVTELVSDVAVILAVGISSTGSLASFNIIRQKEVNVIEWEVYSLINLLNPVCLQRGTGVRLFMLAKLQTSYLLICDTYCY